MWISLLLPLVNLLFEQFGGRLPTYLGILIEAVSSFTAKAYKWFAPAYRGEQFMRLAMQSQNKEQMKLQERNTMGYIIALGKHILLP